MKHHELSRRTFLEHAGAAAAGASVVTARAFPQEAGADVRPVGPPVRHHPAHELDDGTADDPAEWAAVKPGLHVSFASKDSCYFKHVVPAIAPVREHSERPGEARG